MPSIILEVIGTRTQASGHQSYDRTTRKWSCLAKEVFVWCKKGKAFNPKNTVGSILLRDFFSATGPDNLVRVDCITRKEQNIKLLDENIKQTAEIIQLSHH